jgi:S1-C subfamily serine protease
MKGLLKAIGASRLLPWSIVLVTVFLTCRPRAAPADSGALSATASASAVATPPPAPVPQLPAPGSRIEDERNTIAVFRAVAPSTVYVTQTRIVEDWFAGTAQEVPAGSGSGFVWDDKGHVVTNFHVVDGARSVTVTLQDQKTYDAQIVGLEPRKDIAVLKIDAPATSLVPIRVAKGGQIEVGQKTIAIGNPFGLDHTLTTGIVSAIGRQVQGAGGVTIRDMIQTDAAINPGNSGGPLLDSQGQLIGMNTMIYSKSGSSAGIGFAVPVATIARTVPQIIKTGRAEQVGLGIVPDPVGRLERQLSMRGVIVLQVAEASPAAKAGIHGLQRTRRGIVIGDVIVGVDGKRVDDFDALYTVLDTHKAEDVVKVSILRGDKVVDVDVKLIVLPQPNLI